MYSAFNNRKKPQTCTTATTRQIESGITTGDTTVDSDDGYLESRSHFRPGSVSASSPHSNPHLQMLPSGSVFDMTSASDTSTREMWPAAERGMYGIPTSRRQTVGESRTDDYAYKEPRTSRTSDQFYGAPTAREISLMARRNESAKVEMGVRSGPEFSKA